MHHKHLPLHSDQREHSLYTTNIKVQTFGLYGVSLTHVQPSLEVKLIEALLKRTQAHHSLKRYTSGVHKQNAAFVSGQSDLRSLVLRLEARVAQRVHERWLFQQYYISGREPSPASQMSSTFIFKSMDASRNTVSCKFHIV